MKIALSEGREVQAAAGAPDEAVCPDCGKRVELKFLTRGGRRIYYYRHCREEPPQQAPKPEQVRGDPFLVMGSTAVEEAIESARDGDLVAVLNLAFSPLVHGVLGLVDLAPEEVLEIVTPHGREMVPAVVFSGDLDTVSRGAQGPIFDLRSGEGEAKNVEEKACYVPLGRPSPWQARMVQRVMRRTQRAYLIGGDNGWKDTLRAPGFGY